MNIASQMRKHSRSQYVSRRREKSDSNPEKMIGDASRTCGIREITPNYAESKVSLDPGKTASETEGEWEHYTDVGELKIIIFKTKKGPAHQRNREIRNNL